MKTDRYLRVFYKDRLVGTLALTREKKAAFEYADEWLEEGFPISPFSLPLKKQVFIPAKDFFMVCSAYLRTVCRMPGGTFF